MQTLTLHPKNKQQLTALKAFAKAFKIDFETEESPYNPEFVQKVLKGVNARKSGKPGKKIEAQNLWK